MNPTYPEPSSGFTQVCPTTIYGKIIQFPLVRFVLALAFLAPAGFIHRQLVSFLEDEVTEQMTDFGTVIDGGVGLLLLLFSYWAYCRLVERRRPAELSCFGVLPEFVKGIALAVLLIGLSLAIILLFSDFSMTAGPKGWSVLIVGFFALGAPALVEEIMFRLILFRLTEEWLGSWPAVLLQAIFFGFAHGSNPGATLWSSVAIVISAGGLLAAVYLYTRRIWMVWSIHLFWNYLQSALFGLPVSGRTDEGLLETTLDGPVWITGGEFGIEASVITVLVCLAVGLVFYRMAITQNRIVAPSWVRNRQIESSEASSP